MTNAHQYQELEPRWLDRDSRSLWSRPFRRWHPPGGLGTSKVESTIPRSFHQGGGSNGHSRELQGLSGRSRIRQRCCGRIQVASWPVAKGERCQALGWVLFFPGPWNFVSDHYCGFTGSWVRENIGGGLDAMSLSLFTNVLGWTVEEVQHLVALARKDMKNPRIHAYWPAYVVYGQKPE